MDRLPRPWFFLPMRVLSRLFRRLFLEGLAALHTAGQLQVFGDLAGLADPAAFAAYLAPLRRADWVVIVPKARLRHDAKPPFGGPEAVLAYLSRYTHRVAISNSRLVSADADTVAFRWKDYRIKTGDRQRVMRLETAEFMRRFLIHVLPDGFHRIRHYGLLAGATRKATIARIRTLLAEASPARDRDPHTPGAEIVPLTLREPCPWLAAGQCASSRSSGGATDPGRAHPRETRPHDDTPISPTATAPNPPEFTHRPACAHRRNPRVPCTTPAVAAHRPWQRARRTHRHRGAISPQSQARNDLHPHRPRAFAIGSAQTPAASSFRDLSTWAATGQLNRHAAAHIEKSSGVRTFAAFKSNVRTAAVSVRGFSSREGG
jgi:hypothetical protein